MKVIWNKNADRQFDQVAEYIRMSFGTKRRNEFIREVRQITILLEHNPELGAIEPLFSDRPITYRSIVINSLNKLVYYIEDDSIRVAAFWDTRREPTQQAKIL